MTHSRVSYFQDTIGYNSMGFFSRSLSGIGAPILVAGPLVAIAAICSGGCSESVVWPRVLPADDGFEVSICDVGVFF